MSRLLKFFSSIRLTVVLLGLSVLLVFLATLSQMDMGVRGAQVKFFMSFFALWQYPLGLPYGASLHWIHIPQLGGWSLGGLLMINLICAHFRYFKLSARSFGIGLIHGGVVLLLIGQFITDLFQVDSSMQIELGKSSNFVSRFHDFELAVSEPKNATTESVTAISTSRLKPGSSLQVGALPFTIKTTWFEPNTKLVTDRGPNDPTSTVTQGIWTRMKVGITAADVDNSMEGANAPAVIVELADAQKSLGTWLVRAGIDRESITVGDRTFFLEMRNERQYLPYSIELKNLKHDVYEGTDTPKAFESDVVLSDPRTQLTRRFLVEMNEPLRHGGLTFYQYQMNRASNYTVFQVVENPGVWLPYLACFMVSIGLVWVFGFSLNRFRERQA